MEFSLCSTLVVYQQGSEGSLSIEFSDDRKNLVLPEAVLDSELSKEIFDRKGLISRIVVTLARE